MVKGCKLSDAAVFGRLIQGQVDLATAAGRSSVSSISPGQSITVRLTTRRVINRVSPSLHAILILMVIQLREASPDQIESLWTSNFACLSPFGNILTLAWGAPLDLQGYIVYLKCKAIDLLVSRTHLD